MSRMLQTRSHANRLYHGKAMILLGSHFTVVVAVWTNTVVQILGILAHGARAAIAVAGVAVVGFGGTLGGGRCCGSCTGVN